MYAKGPTYHFVNKILEPQDDLGTGSYTWSWAEAEIYAVTD